MRDRILALTVMAALSLMVFVFFFIRTQPIPIPKSKLNTESNAIKVPSVTFIDPSIGPQDAKIVVVEYSDFECEACKLLNPILDTLRKTYPNDVRIVWKDMPNDSAHPNATSAATAAHCAAKQNKFWEYATSLFEKQGYLTDALYYQIATELKLNEDTFRKCVSTQDTLALVKKNFQEGKDLGIVATPTIYVGSTPFVGTPTSDELTQFVAQQLSTISQN